MKSVVKKLTSMLIALLMCLSISACSNTTEEKKETESTAETTAANESKAEATETKKLKIGCMSITEPIVDVLGEEMKKAGYEVETVMFDGNSLPCIALTNGDIDGVILNHRPWLLKFNEENNSNLIMPEPYMYYSRTAVYSSRHKKTEDLPEHAQIVIPGDPANMERALIILRDMGLITLGEKTGEFYTTLDITENPKNIELVEAEITATMRSINDVDAVVGGANTAERSGLDPNVFLYEDPDALNFPLGLIIDEKDENAEWVKQAMDISQTEEFKKKFKQHYNGTYVLFND